MESRARPGNRAPGVSGASNRTRPLRGSPRWFHWDSFATHSSSQSTRTGSQSWTSTWHTSGCSSSRWSSGSGSGDLESQGLLEPLLIEVPVAQRDTLLARRDVLGRCGFAIEPFGGDSLRVTAVPALLRPADCTQALTALSEDLDGLERAAPVEEALRRIAATMACHAAVKAHDPLSLEKMRYILDELRRTAYSTVCPHGRPVVLRLTRREIEKNFQRI